MNSTVNWWLFFFSQQHLLCFFKWTCKQTNRADRPERCPAEFPWRHGRSTFARTFFSLPSPVHLHRKQWSLQLWGWLTPQPDRAGSFSLSLQMLFRSPVWELHASTGLIFPAPQNESKCNYEAARFYIDWNCHLSSIVFWNQCRNRLPSLSIWADAYTLRVLINAFIFQLWWKFRVSSAHSQPANYWSGVHCKSVLTQHTALTCSAQTACGVHAFTPTSNTRTRL